MKIETHTPHVEPGWAEAFLLELRLRSVAGDHIGAALAEVEAHCAESGESAASAFGDPATYAADLAPTLPATALDLRGELATSVLGLGGMLLALAAVGAWQTGDRVEVTAGHPRHGTGRPVALPRPDRRDGPAPAARLSARP